MKKRKVPHILVANDDGVYSPGILSLARCAAAFGTVRVVAPDVERSSAGHSVTASRPLNYKPADLPGLTAFRVNGTPADCVSMGIHLWGENVDVVLSGINLGSNLGNSAWHSGTLAAAKQAVLLGTRGMALSAPSIDGDPDFRVLRPWITRVLKLLLPLQDLPLLNVNFPARKPRGILWTRQSVRQYDGRIVKAADPMGREHYWFTVVPLNDPEPETDRWAVEKGYISITPLRLDLTDEKALLRANAEVKLNRARRGKRREYTKRP